VASAILGRPLATSETDAFLKYLILLLKWQRSQRLVGTADPAWIVDNLLLDSLLFLRVLPTPLTSLLDLGAGAGVPGIPLKIVRPDVDVILVESRRRRASFLSAAVRELGLRRTRVINARAEALEGQMEVDAVVMRCAAGAASLTPTALGLLRRGGILVVSGPPRAATSPPPDGRWVEVDNPITGTRRRFRVYERA
jgi:16S rRNA (guanine527-N7)-methyltransferase